MGGGVDCANQRKKPAVLPNLGGSLPNDIFTDVLGLRTVWVPHSMQGARSTHRMNICRPSSCATGCASWPASIGISVPAKRR